MTCKERVWHYHGHQFTTQCSREAKIDGYCKQHHPDSIKKRKAKQQQRWEKSRIQLAAQRENRIRIWANENGFKLVKEEE